MTTAGRRPAPRGRLLAFCVCTVPALLVALGQPIWSRVDEAQHADFVAQLAHGTYPVEGRTFIRPGTLDLMAETGVFRWNVPGEQPVPITRNTAAFQHVPTYLHGYARKVWIERHLWSFSYEAVQPPLYYLAAVPFWLAGEHLAGTRGGVYAVRVFDALLLGLLGVLTLTLAGLVLPGRPRPAWLAVALVALLPGLLLNGTQVSNDPAAALMGAAALAAAIAGRARGWPLRWAALTGVLLGAAAMTKLTTLGLALPVAAALAWPDARPWRDRAQAGGLAAALALLVVTPWLALNFHLYGHPLPTQANQQLLGAVFPLRLSPAFVAGSLRNAFATYWAGEPYREVPLHQLTTYLMAAWTLVAAAGVWVLARRARQVWLVVLAVVGEVLWALGTLSVAGVGGWTPGRYLDPIAAAAGVLAAVGLLEVVRSRALQAAAFGLFALSAVVNVGGFLLGYTGYSQIDRAGPPPDVATYPLDAHGEFAGVVIEADRLVADTAQDCLWVHVDAVNGSGGAVDWWPVIYLRPAGLADAVEAEYADSTAFPDTLEPGQQVNGWMKVPIPPSELHWPVQASLVDIAVDGYHRLGDVAMSLKPALTS